MRDTDLKKILSGGIARFMESGNPVFTLGYLLESANGWGCPTGR